MTSFTEQLRFTSSSVKLGDSLIFAISRLVQLIACDIARQSNRTIITENDVNAATRRAFSELDQAAADSPPEESPRRLLDLITTMAEKYAPK